VQKIERAKRNREYDKGYKEARLVYSRLSLPLNIRGAKVRGEISQPAQLKKKGKNYIPVLSGVHGGGGLKRSW